MSLNLNEKKWLVPVSGDCVNALSDSLSMGPIIEVNGADRRQINEDLVDSIEGLKVYIYADEHPPPHFHVMYNGESNSFRISNGEPIYPKGLNKYFKNIRKWFDEHRPTLVRIWNDTRPTDCPVGSTS